MIDKNIIKSTKAFEKLDNVQQKILLRLKSKKEIHRGVLMSEYKNLDYWVEKTNPRPNIFNVVKEIIELKNPLN